MKKFKHVVIYGMDGGGAFVKFANTPNIDRIFEKGAYTFRAYASNPSISAECWGSMLLGVSPAVHKMTNEYITNNEHPLTSKWPSLYRRIREAYPDAKLGAFCDWYPIINGIVEHDIGVTTFSDRDEELTRRACEYIKSEKPDFLFFHSDSVDGAGHGNGYGTVAHLNQIAAVDVYINQIYQAIVDAGMEEDTLFCLICDHGGTLDKTGEFGKYRGGHGGWSNEEKLITFAAIGKGVKGGEIEEMNIRDIASVVLYALGIPAPEFEREGWTSQIPANLFEDYAPEYKDISDETGAEPRVSKIRHTSQTL